MCFSPPLFHRLPSKFLFPNYPEWLNMAMTIKFTTEEMKVINKLKET
jgi:hypothetical protein